MRKTVLIVYLLLWGAAWNALAAPPKADLYVALNGNDSWSGKLDAPNAARTDGPFATMARAQQAVRQMKKEAGHTGGVTVLIRGGLYYLPDPLVFTPDDSGLSAEAPIVYAAYPGEQPILSGGMRLTDWHLNKLNQWECYLPEVAAGKWVFSQLFADGQRRPRPRMPKFGYYFINGSLGPSPASEGKGYDRFLFKPGEIRAGWNALHDVEALCFQTWTMARLRIGSVDEKTHVVSFTGNTHGLASYSALPRGNRFILENIKEALQDPGEWYLDRKTGVLTYIPKEGETPQKISFIAPRLEHLLVLQGDLTAKRWVENLRFEGLIFAHTNWNAPPEGNAFAQAEVNIDAALMAEGARGCAFSGCAIRHTGNYALSWGAGCQNDTVENCALTDLGAGGVKIGEMNIRDDADLVTQHITVQNCLIDHCGRLHPAAVGVWIGQSPGNQILHNDIDDLYYTGISAGWTWGYGKSLAHDNRIAYNRIGDIGQGVLSDMGGIYTLGVSPGTILDHNVLHDIESYDYGGWGIYMDEGSSNETISNNIVYRTKTGGFHQHYGQENHVTNNIFAFSREGQIIRTRAEDHLSFTFDHNIVYFKEGTLLGSNWSGDQYKLSANDYWDAGGKPVDFNGLSLAQWQEKGQDRDSIVADPLFAAPEDGNFRLKPDSPALKLGFHPIDVSEVGTHQAGPMKLALTPVSRAFPPPPPPQPPLPISEDFELTAVGQTAPDAITSEEPNGGTARVTDETAASGKHSLKFIDKAGQKFSYNPHVYWQPRFDSGHLTGSFALQLEPGAIFYHEWRDNANPYHVGPSLRVSADGKLTAGNTFLEQLPFHFWVRITIECSLGEQADGKYSVTVEMPNHTIQHYADLPCDPQFRSLRWYGFVSDTDGPSVFYLDDVQLHP